MKVSKPKYFKKFSVIFKPDEAEKFLNKFPNARCLNMIPRTDLKPWGTREALMEEKIDLKKVDIL
jgi:hypothetical protein